MKSSLKTLQLKTILLHIYGKSDIEKAARKMGASSENFNTLLTLINKDVEIAPMASWLARSWAEKNPKLIIKFIPKVLKSIEASEHDSVIRNLSGIIVDHGLTGKTEGKAADLFMRYLTQTTRAFAVHASGLAILEKICRKYPELKAEIKLITDHHPNASAASFQARVKRFKFQ